jgi:hypothetical protein
VEARCTRHRAAGPAPGPARRASAPPAQPRAPQPPFAFPRPLSTAGRRRDRPSFGRRAALVGGAPPPPGYRAAREGHPPVPLSPPRARRRAQPLRRLSALQGYVGIIPRSSDSLRAARRRRRAVWQCAPGTRPPRAAPRSADANQFFMLAPASSSGNILLARV